MRPILKQHLLVRFLRIVNNWPVPVAIFAMVLFTSTAVFHAQLLPHHHGQGVVQETVQWSDQTVVLFPDGQFAALDGVSVGTGQEVEVYKSSWSDPTVSPLETWKIVSMAAVLGVVSAFVTLFAMALVAPGLQHLQRSRERY